MYIRTDWDGATIWVNLDQIRKGPLKDTEQRLGRNTQGSENRQTRIHDHASTNAALPRTERRKPSTQGAFNDKIQESGMKMRDRKVEMRVLHGKMRNSQCTPHPVSFPQLKSYPCTTPRTAHMHHTRRTNRYQRITVTKIIYYTRQYRQERRLVGGW